MDIDRDDIRRLLDCLNSGRRDLTIDPEDVIRSMCEFCLEWDEAEQGAKTEIHEVFAQLPAEDEFTEPIEALIEAVEMNKPEMIERVKNVINWLESKEVEYTNALGFASDIVKRYD